MTCQWFSPLGVIALSLALLAVASGSSSLHVVSKQSVTGLIGPRPVGHTTTLLELYDSLGQHQRTWQAAGEPLLWFTESGRLLFLSPNEDGYRYVVGDPATQRVYRASKTIAVPHRWRALFGNRMFVSCEQRLLNCLAIVFEEPVVSATLLRSSVALQESDGSERAREFVAGFDVNSEREWIGWVTFGNRLLSARTCNMPTLWPSISEEWMIVHYEGRDPWLCSELVLVSPTGSQAGLDATIDGDLARQLRLGPSAKPNRTSPDGKWYVVGNGGEVAVTSLVDEVDAPVSGEGELDVWWHVDSEMFAFADDSGVAVGWIDGRRRQLVTSGYWTFVGWVGGYAALVGLDEHPPTAVGAPDSTEAADDD